VTTRLRVVPATIPSWAAKATIACPAGAVTTTSAANWAGTFNSAATARTPSTSYHESVKGADADVLRDFSHKEGDTIDLSAIDAKEGGADNAFKYIDDNAFTGKKGQLRFDNRKLTGDIDGDGKADFMIKVEVAKLVAADFVL
jgi:hypothetical protein